MERQEARYLTPDEVRALVAGFAGDRLRALNLLMLGTGLRRGEALASRWGDVDLDAGHLRVRGTLGRVGGKLTITEPKTEKSRRTVPLPEPVVVELRAHRLRQVEERPHAGSAWTDQGLVFCTQTGAALDSRSTLRSLATVAKRVGLLHVGVHTLRHSAASALISSGVHMKVVQELLGHSSYAITADAYAHVGVAQQKDAADRLAEAFGWCAWPGAIAVAVARQPGASPKGRHPA